MFFTFLCYKCIQYTFISFFIIVRCLKITIKKTKVCLSRERLNIIQLRLYVISVFILIKGSFWNLLANWDSPKKIFRSGLIHISFKVQNYSYGRYAALNTYHIDKCQFKINLTLNLKKPIISKNETIIYLLEQILLIKYSSFLCLKEFLNMKKTHWWQF